MWVCYSTFLLVNIILKKETHLFCVYLERYFKKKEWINIYTGYVNLNQGKRIVRYYGFLFTYCNRACHTWETASSYTQLWIGKSFPYKLLPVFIVITTYHEGMHTRAFTTYNVYSQRACSRTNNNARYVINGYACTLYGVHLFFVGGPVLGTVSFENMFTHVYPIGCIFLCTAILVRGSTFPRYNWWYGSS